jgi:hypothetical protein
MLPEALLNKKGELFEVLPLWLEDGLVRSLRIGCSQVVLLYHRIKTLRFLLSMVIVVI